MPPTTPVPAGTSRVERLQAVTSELASALEADHIAEILVEHGFTAVGASTGSLYLVDAAAGHARLLRSRGVVDATDERLAAVPLASPSPLGDALRSGTAVLLADRATYAARYPQSIARWKGSVLDGISAIACIPLLDPDGVVLGGLALGFAAERPFDTEERAFLQLLAHHGAQALFRAQVLVREQTAARQAQEASRLKDEFLATVSHELRTPLASIVSWAQSLEGDRRSDPDHVARAARIIERNARTQMRLVEDLLDLSRIIRGQLRIDALPVELELLARDVLDGIRPSAEAKQIDLRLEAQPGVRLVGDPDRLRQILWNLLSNAVKFTPGGGRVSLHLAQDGARVSIRVRDDGRGIDPAFLPLVFDRFTQADRGPARAQGGVGLGLAIVRHLVEMHGGTVTASSDGVGKGSTFEVALPVKPFSAELRTESADAARESAGGPLAGLRVLIVEDEPDSRELIEVLLMSEGAVVVAAGSAEEALEKLGAFDPQLLVSDIGMPRHDGTWLVGRVHERLPGLPAIALTAFTRPEDVTRILAAGFHHHLGKPVDPEQLVQLAARAAALPAAR